MSNEESGDNNGRLEINIVGEVEPADMRMIIVKVLACGDVHAETSEGEMIIFQNDGKVKSYIHGDENWVEGVYPNTNLSNCVSRAWETIGFHFGLTAGSNMESVRYGSENIHS